MSTVTIEDRMQAMIAASDHVSFLKNQVTCRVMRLCDSQPWIEKPITLRDGTTQVSPSSSCTDTHPA